MLRKTIRNASIAMILGTTMMSTSASAKEADFGFIYTACGLGGMIGSIVDNKTASQVMAVITNITFDLGTTASISYYSSVDTCYNTKATTAAFIYQSYENLEKEIAMGEGDYFDALAALAADDQESVEQYKADLRKQFALIVADDSYTQLSRYEKVENLFGVAI